MLHLYVTPAHKKEERTKKENYRPVSIDPLFLKYLISLYIEKYLLQFICGFCKGFSTQHCIIVMLDRWKKAIDSGKLAGALLIFPKHLTA